MDQFNVGDAVIWQTGSHYQKFIRRVSARVTRVMAAMVEIEIDSSGGLLRRRVKPEALKKVAATPPSSLGRLVVEREARS